MRGFSKLGDALCLPRGVRRTSRPLCTSAQRRNPHGTKNRLGLGLAVASLLLGVWPGLAAGPDQASEKQPSAVVETKEGPVQGFTSNGVSKFLGIPYAEPPVGDLRWRPPKDHAPWTNVLKATEFAPICALVTTLGVFSGAPNNNEDCLYLNVFTPDLNPSARLPVIVWIHGGGNVDGETPGYDGSKLAAQGKTVVVTMAYRLNLMGFLAHPALDNEGHLFGNYGILDQQAVLKWVARNIASFGGDKDNVTVGGQSAGAVDTGLHMMSPLAAGLFHRGICQSFCPAFALPTKAAAEATGVAFAVAAGCGSGTGPEVAQCLRSLPAARVEELAGTASTIGKFITGRGLVDGADHPRSAADAVRRRPVQPRAADERQHGGRDQFRPGDHGIFLQHGQRASHPANRGTVSELRQHDLRAARLSRGHRSESPCASIRSAPSKARIWPGIGSEPIPAFATSAGLIKSSRRKSRSIPMSSPTRRRHSSSRICRDMEALAYHTADIQYLFPLWHGGPLGIPHPLNPQQTQAVRSTCLRLGQFCQDRQSERIGQSLRGRATRRAPKHRPG